MSQNILLKPIGGGTTTARNREDFVGSDGSGNNGEMNRVFTLSESDDVEIVEVFLDGVLLVETSQYTKDNSLKTVTVLQNVFNSQTLSIFYNI